MAHSDRGSKMKAAGLESFARETTATRLADGSPPSKEDLLRFNEVDYDSTAYFIFNEEKNLECSRNNISDISDYVNLFIDKYDKYIQESCVEDLIRKQNIFANSALAIFHRGRVRSAIDDLGIIIFAKIKYNINKARFSPFLRESWFEFVPFRDIIREYLRKRISSDLSDAFSKVCRTNSDKISFLYDVICDIESHFENETAYEMYRDRSDRTESAPDFIKRVYSKRLDGSFTRADLRNLDDACEMGLRNYEKTHGRISLDELNLPTLKEKNVSQRSQLDKIEKIISIIGLKNSPRI